MKQRSLMCSLSLLLAAAAAFAAPAGVAASLAPIGAQLRAVGIASSAATIRVASSAAAIEAISGAREGQVILFAPGSYRFSGRASLWTSKAAGVTVRAAVPGSVMLEFDMLEGIVVHAPRWTFENLHIRGVCAAHDDCEHAFHVVGGGTGFVARNNTILDFNAPFKINGTGGLFPDGGLIESNTVRNTSVRATANPVTLIDLVGASGWRVNANLIADFIKGGGNQTSYGAFAKGAGDANRFERNVVVCEARLRGAPGVRVGLSLGGGSTGPAYCRDKRCASEQSGGLIAGNLVASCSDEGIYLNRAAGSELSHNTLVDTAGIMLRYPETSALVEGNLVDGRIATSKGAQIQDADNLDNALTDRILLRKRLRALFVDAGQLDFRWKQAAPRRAGKAAIQAPELCGNTRPARPAYGAFEDASCLDPTVLLGEPVRP